MLRIEVIIYFSARGTINITYVLGWVHLCEWVSNQDHKSTKGVQSFLAKAAEINK